MKVLVVVPTYQEAANIGPLLRSLRAAAPEAHVLVVDDDSPDGTSALARAEAESSGGIEVLTRSGRLGLSTAHQAGFAYAAEHAYDVVVTMDADGSHDPAEIPTFLEAIATGADLVIGTRYMPGGGAPDWTWSRRLLSRAGNAYASALLRLTSRDSTSGFRAYRTKLLERLGATRVASAGYAFQVELAWRAERLGAVVVESPITFRDRTAGRSKLSTWMVVEALLRIPRWAAVDRKHARIRPLAPLGEPAHGVGPAGDG